MYRVYTGGDEFIFLIEGDLPAALGFANRLVDMFKKIGRDITKETLNEQRELTFVCAVAPLEEGCTYDTVWTQLSDCYTRAVQGEGNSVFVGILECWIMKSMIEYTKRSDAGFPSLRPMRRRRIINPRRVNAKIQLE